MDDEATAGGDNMLKLDSLSAATGSTPTSIASLSDTNRCASLGQTDLEDERIAGRKAMFSPPLAQQRYEIVANIIKERNYVKSVSYDVLSFML